MIRTLMRWYHNQPINGAIAMAETQWSLAFAAGDSLRAKRLRRIIDDLKGELI